MKAMIFAAGLGTRLQPLTNNLPKALVPLCDKTLLLYCLENLAMAGVDEVVINIHHFADKIITYLQKHAPKNIKISFSDEREKLLDTGGGLKNAAWFFKDDNDPFILINVDVLTNLCFAEMIRYHKQNKALATLAVRKRETSRYLLFDKHYRLTGWENVKGDCKKWVDVEIKEYKQFAFSGIHIVSPEIFSKAPQQDTFSIIDWYLELAKKNNIVAYDHSDDVWMDLGKPEQLIIAKQIVDNC